MMPTIEGTELFVDVQPISEKDSTIRFDLLEPEDPVCLVFRM